MYNPTAYNFYLASRRIFRKDNICSLENNEGDELLKGGGVMERGGRVGMRGEPHFSERCIPFYTALTLGTIGRAHIFHLCIDFGKDRQ